MRDPFPLWRELRENAPLYHLGPSLLVTRYDDVKAVLRDTVGFSSASGVRGSRVDAVRARLTTEQRQAFDELTEFESRFVVGLDAPAHTRARKILHRAFTPRRIAELGDATQRYVDELLGPLEAAGAGDLMPLAYRLPLMVICDLLEVPHDDREQIHEWSSTIGRNRQGADPDPRPMLAAHAAMREFRGYVEELIDNHQRARRRSELVEALMTATEGEHMTRDETAVTFIILLFAGHETTTNLIGNGIFELLRRPDQWALLAAEPARTPVAVEELLRYTTPVQWINRRATEGAQIAGTPIEPEQTVLPVIAAANRDPAQFAVPEELDILRDDSRNHVALGFGAHYCLGASLARLEGTAALRTLAERHPGLELTADPDSLVWRSHAKLRSLATLPVALGSA